MRSVVSGFARRFGSQMTKAFRSFCRDHASFFSPLQKPSIVGEQLLGMASGAVVDGVGEIQTGISSVNSNGDFGRSGGILLCQLTLLYNRQT